MNKFAPFASKGIQSPAKAKAAFRKAGAVAFVQIYLHDPVSCFYVYFKNARKRMDGTRMDRTWISNDIKIHWTERTVDSVDSVDWIYISCSLKDVQVDEFDGWRKARWFQPQLPSHENSRCTSKHWVNWLPFLALKHGNKTKHVQQLWTLDEVV